MIGDKFLRLVADIPSIGRDWHEQTLLDNARRNRALMHRSIREVKPLDRAVLVISAGPSLYRQKSLERLSVHVGMRPHPVIVAVDGAYIQCLEHGIIPDYVITMDPHPTRIVRWFGDPDFEAHSRGDDYFARQDLDEAFRVDALATNLRNIGLVDRYAGASRLIVCCCAPETVVERTATFPVRLWFAPIVDNPQAPGSLTYRLADLTRLPSLNTGGTVGSAAVMFAHCLLRAKRIGAIGMDLGYYADTPYLRTQSWNMVKDMPGDARDYYPSVTHPEWGECYVDPTYWWYRQNLLSLLKAGEFTLHNLTGGGSLYGPHVVCWKLEDWLEGGIHD